MTLVIKGREHEPIAVPADLILLDRKLDLFPDLQGERLFRVKLRTDALEVQPTGYIGFIPLNNRVAIEVEPRMPIANVEYLLARSGHTPAVTLPYIRKFSESAANASPFIQLLATRYAALLQELRYEGIYKTYVPQQYVGPAPSGRVLPLPTALRSRLARRATAVYERFDRTLDNSANRVILAAGRQLLGNVVLQDRGGQKLARAISNGLTLFGGVSESRELHVPELTGLPEQRPVLNQLVALSAVVLREQGVRLRGEGLLRLPSFLIKMEDVFEAYTRTVLQDSEVLSRFEIKDGNKQAPLGGAIQLFSNVGPLGNRDATPDIVININNEPTIIVEVKYKPCKGQPDRDNLNQLLTYAIAYNVRTDILLYPAMDKQATGLERLGDVQGIECYMAKLRLDSNKIADEESKLCSEIRKLL